MAFSGSPSPHVSPSASINEKPKGFSPTTAVILAATVAFIFWRPDTAKTIAIFLVMLGVLVFVHEWGHYQFARWAGMKVNRFGIGFPPWIYTVRRNDIDYSIGALPLGGMVDIAGLGSEEEMVATGKDSTGTGTAATTVSGVAAESNTKSRFDSYRYRNPSAPHGTKNFQDANLGWRFWTLFAGPLMNFIFALVVFVGVYSIIGVPDKVAQTNIVEMAQAGMPAAQAGIQSDDAIIAINGRKSTDPVELTKLIRQSKGPLQVTLVRDGQTLQKTVKPIVDEVENLKGTGKEKAPLIGVMFNVRIDSYQRLSLPEAVDKGWTDANFITTQIFGLLGRAATSNLSQEDKRGVGGPVKIAQAVGQSAKRGWQETLLLSAALSVNLGLMNLLPFPALDGGRILFLGYELVMRRPLDPQKEGLVHMVGMVMLLAFMLFITVRDVVPFFQGLR